MSNSDRIIGLKVLKEKGMPGETRSELELIAGKGILGDRHADGGLRQITLLSKKARDFVDRSEIKGLCFSRYKENILLEGDLLDHCSTGDRLYIHDAILVISETSKQCFPGCSWLENRGECPLKSGSAAAYVEKTGRICVGDESILHRE